MVGPDRVEMETLVGMTRTLRHRGPDDEGFLVREYDDGVAVGLGFRRLSIVDLQSGNQPIGNESGAVQVVFNGEIYNFPTLRRELEERGHRFSTHADTEVIPHLYEELGPRCVERLNGMFAFALWDEARRELLLARDRFGKKPLYYAQVGRSLIFGSELKSLLEHPSCPSELDPEGLSRYLALEYVPTPHAIFTGVRKLPGGHVLRWRDGRVSVDRYWSLSFGSETLCGRSGHRRRVRRGADRTASGSGPATPHERCPARRLPERGNRLELDRGDDGRGDAVPGRQDVLDRVRREELRRVGARAARGRALRHRPPRGDLHASGDDRRPAVGRRRSRRAVRGRVDPADLRPLAVHAGVGHSRTRRRWERRAARRVPDVPGGARRAALCDAEAPPRARGRPSGRPAPGVDRELQRSTSSSSGSCAGRRLRRMSATRCGSARSRRPSRPRCSTGSLPIRSRSSGACSPRRRRRAGSSG